ncbi:phage repressor protein [Streptococcus danieliae]|nr:phage repressor protein [Streptococcus danieliae]
MTAQVSIFEDDTRQIIQVVTTTEFNGHPLDIYGNIDEPLFLARAVAEMIDYQKNTQGYYNTPKMMKLVDDDEKFKASIPNRDSPQPMWFLTEQGLYEVLFQSRKPIAKEFKKWVKQVLKEIRQQGYYMNGELVGEPAGAETYTQALPTLEQAENNYIDTVAKAIQESGTRAEKVELIERLNKFISGL